MGRALQRLSQPLRLFGFGHGGRSGIQGWCQRRTKPNGPHGAVPRRSGDRVGIRGGVGTVPGLLAVLHRPALSARFGTSAPHFTRRRTAAVRSIRSSRSPMPSSGMQRRARDWTAPGRAWVDWSGRRWVAPARTPPRFRGAPRSRHPPSERLRGATRRRSAHPIRWESRCEVRSTGRPGRSAPKRTGAPTPARRQSRGSGSIKARVR